MNSGWFVSFRLAIGLLAALVGASAIWIFAAEFTRPPLPYFLANPEDAATFSAVRTAAMTAAEFGRVRGDLWTAAALTQAAPLLSVAPGKQTEDVPQSEIDSVRTAIERAAKWAPHDSRNWLSLAALESRRADIGPGAAEALKLSYYTGPNEFALAPLRLFIACRLNWDEELQSFVQLEIERIILQRPELKPVIAVAYKTAVPFARQFIEATLEQADPDFLATLIGSSFR